MLLGGKIVSNKNNKFNPTSASFDLQIARLVYIGSTISTLGGGLQTLAAALTLNALEKANAQNFQNPQSFQSQSKQPNQDPEDLKLQIDSIIKELKEIKKII